MVRLLKLYLPALLKKFFLFYFVMLILGALATSLFNSAISAYLGFYNANLDYVSEYNYPDIVLSCDLTNKNKLNYVENVEGVSEVNYRISYLCECKYNDKLLTSRVVSVSNESLIKLYLVDGDLSDSGIYLERNYAENNNIKVGDFISIKCIDSYIDVKVVALVQSVETTFFSLTSFLSADSIDSGAIYVSDNYYKSVLKDILQKKGILKFSDINIYNEILINIKDNYDDKEVLDNCLSALDNKVKVNNTQSKDELNSIKNMDSYLNTISKISILVPAIFYFLMLIISLLFYMQIIKNSYKNIGILMMQGYKKGNIIFLFEIISLLISVLSFFLGLFIGRFLLKFLVYIYGRHHLIPFVYEKYDFKVALLSLIFCILVSFLSSLFSFMLLRNVSPKKVVDNDFNITFKVNSKLGKKHSKISNFAIYNTLAFSSLRCNPRRFLISIFVFMASFILMFLSFSINISNNTVLDQYCNIRLNYDASVLLVDGIDDDTYDALISNDFIMHAEKGGICSASIENERYSQSVVVQILSSNHELVGISSKNNKDLLDVDENGIILDQSIAKKLNVKENDEILLNNISVNVVNLSSLYQAKSIIISQEMASILNLSYYDVIYLKCSDLEKLKEYLISNDISSFVINSENTKTNAYKSSASYSIFTSILIIFSILIGLVVISILNISSFNEQKRRLSVMRVLGFKISQISIIWFIQFIICFIIALVFAIFLANIISLNFMNLISGSSITYPFINDIRLYIYPILLIIVFYIFAHFISIRSVRKFNLAENTRARE